MADISVTAAAVLGTKSGSLNASTSLTAGQVVTPDTNGKAALSDCNNAAVAAVQGFTLNAAGTNQPVAIHGNGADLTMNAALTAGTFYYLSATPGAICPFADLVSTCRVIQIGYAKSTTVLAVNIVDTGIVL